MANGYPIGVSSQPIDFTSGALAFAQSAVEERKKEIEQNQQQVSENYKNVLKAASIKTIPELSNKLRATYQTKIDDYRKEIMDKFRQSKGKLSSKQQLEIQNGFVDMQQNMLTDVNKIKQIEEAQKVMYNPDFKYAYNRDAYASELGQIIKDVDNGKDVGNISARLYRHAIPPSITDVMFKNFANDIKNLDLQSNVKQIAPNQFRITTTQKEGEVNSKLDYFFKTNPFLAANDTPENRQIAKDAVIHSVDKTQLFNPKTSQGSGKYKNATDYTPTPFEYKGKSYSLIRVPSDVTQTERNFFVDNAINLDTNKKTQLTQDNAQIVGIDVEDGVLLLQGKGGKAQKGGELVYTPEGISSQKNNGQWSGNVESWFDSSEHVKSALEGAYEGTGKIKEIKNVDVTKDGDDNIILSGTAVVKEGLLGKPKEVLVKRKYNTFVDPSSEAVYEAPLYQNKEAVANMFPKVSVYGKPLEQYFNEQPKKQSVPELDKQKLLDQGYSEKQIQDAVSSGKIKLK